ncbi:MAG: hypothetical protein QOG80_202 [Pseudonocardiales bacterium]|nr:hypothetical protein [Pseudonocardiales bacterium]
MPDHSGSAGRHTYLHPEFQASAELAEPVTAPGVAAFFRRHPQHVRMGAAGSMATGVVLFVVASLMASAGADPAKPAAAPPAPAYTLPIDTYTGLPSTPAPETSSAHPALAKPKHAKKPAPSDPSAISGLAANGIPSVALNAYRVASARLANADPGCGIDWALLAGIGREESDHGRFAGAVLHADGVSTPRIIGIPLNGKGTALIRDTDRGALDGDTVYDHAVGPMQFIPSTWAEYGTDANGDGHANAFDINDAALTAARYLCAAGGNLRSHAGQVAAVLAYNHSDQYLAQVLALADAYRRGIPISGIPIGNITGTLPPVDPGAVPPANPGPPTANQSTAKSSGSTSSTPTHSAAPTTSTSSGSGGGTGGGSGGAGGGGTSTSPTPTPTSSSSTPSTPSPTGTRACLVKDLFDPTHCIIWQTP